MHRDRSEYRVRNASRGDSTVWRILLGTVSTGLAALALVPYPAASQEVGKDVPPGHWAYQAVQDLASKGLIKGYPPDADFLGKRTLTRYEMATILQRVVARMDDLVSHSASKEDLDKLASSQAEIRELVDSFKTEMTVIGTDMQTVKKDLASLQAQVSDLDSRVGSLSQKVDDTSLKADQAQQNVEKLQQSTQAALEK
ncbi:MAG TPA: S-layer homology domain-containing protein, partial [Chthonomonadaceae bacterium]|nr:S-layer homology domain-containing protein [Chthonomonadaceae bacterium]